MFFVFFHQIFLKFYSNIFQVVEVGSKKHTLLGAAIVSRHTELVALLLEGGEDYCEVLGEERGGCVELALATRHPDIISLVTRARRPGKQEL